MSHTTRVQLKFSDRETLKKAIENAGYVYAEKKVKLFSTEHRGIAVHLKGWRYPVVFEESGELKYDNFGGRWGKKEELDTFLTKVSKEYAKAVSKKFASRLKGKIKSVQEEKDKVVIEIEIPD